jgi:hypothetical protein
MNASRKDFLFVAHPGHELCVHAWLEIARPRVFVLTDGSGHTGKSRIESTTAVLAAAGAESGSIYGRLSDKELYTAILNNDFELFIALAEEFAAALASGPVQMVAGDAIEGFNPGHDVCRLIINTAVKLARDRHGISICNREFLLVGRHDTYPRELRNQATWLELEPEAFQRKLRMANKFKELRTEIDAAFRGELLALQSYPELAADLTLEYNSLGIEAYRVECLQPAEERPLSGRFESRAPFYERYGELRVADGTYRDLIRFREHMLPLAEALEHHADMKTIRGADGGIKPLSEGQNPNP